MKTMKTITQFLVLFAFISIASGEDKARESQTDDIREAVFRWQFEHNASGQQQKAKVYFLQIGEKDKGDPSDQFMKRFVQHKPSVRKVSQCAADTRKGVLDKQTGEKGLIFRIAAIEWKSDTEVAVSGGYYEAGLSASGNTYTVKKVDGKWTVTKDEMHWIS
jgi:hypothetical protein